MASITYGAAGLAYALLRLARAGDDAALLSDADVWATKAVAAIPADTAFWNPALGIVPDVFGRASLFHHAAGVYCVAGLIAHARGDDQAFQDAVQRFIESGFDTNHIDVAFGRSGLLLACALLADVAPSTMDDSALMRYGDDLAASVWADVVREGSIANARGLRTLGAAHGWAGVLFAVLRWSECTGRPPPEGIEKRLDELVALGQPGGRAMRWPRLVGEPINQGVLTPSWCNGTAGYTQLWTIAARRLGGATYRRLAEMAAWSAYEDAPDALGNLCCGLAGRAYALLALHRLTGDELWRARARVIGTRALATPLADKSRINSLYHGEPGIVLLAADLDSSESASMPLFQGEGWPSRGGRDRPRAQDIDPRRAQHA